MFGGPEPLPEDRLEKALLLRNTLVKRAIGEGIDDATYRRLRKEFMEDETTRMLLPAFVRSCMDTGDFWGYIQPAFPSYKLRTAHIREQFQPLLAHLEQRASPAAEMISDALMSYDESGVHAAWRKALRRSADDAEGAITAARTLLESVCKHILDEARPDGSGHGPGDDLPKLYKAASEELNLAPSQHSEEIFKQVLGGCAGVVGGLGALRNKVGDAHGHGKRAVRASPRHAHLAVNLAGAMALFLVETFVARSSPAGS